MTPTPLPPAGVSIQLVSPARGELPSDRQGSRGLRRVSIQLVSPARGELGGDLETMKQLKFPFNWFPLREGR